MSNRKVVVTGAAHGLGLAIARRFSASGASVLLVDRDSAVHSRIGEEDFPSSRTFSFVKDLSEPDAAPLVFDYAKGKLGLVDTLINCAGWSYHKPILEVTVEEFDRLIAVNQRAPFFLAQEFLRQIQAAKTTPEDPAIVNIASVNALIGNPNLAPYAGTKGALVAMTYAMAVEMQSSNVRVNAVSPAAVETHVTKGLIASGVIDTEELLTKYLIKRLAAPEEIADLVAYLCSAKGRYVNGSNWPIDGGYLAQ